MFARGHTSRTHARAYKHEAMLLNTNHTEPLGGIGARSPEVVPSAGGKVAVSLAYKSLWSHRGCQAGDGF